ncbi:sensor histidine kinase [candidate division KSB1 bacterium]|nr:sensor histidine kinase [candidate division KSB1 bacterium]
MKKLNWPIFADHITKDGELCKGSLSDLNGVGIISNEYLKGLLTQIASVLENPNTILEFPPDAGKDPVRTDSISIHYDMHPPCRKFREGTCMSFCNKCDILHANLFRDIEETQIHDELVQRINSSGYKTKFLQEYGIESDLTVETYQDRCFIKYTCPHLGYQELVFPIIFEKKIIAAFFVGQLLIEGHLEKVDMVKDIFFRKNKDCFDEYNNSHPGDKIDINDIYRIDHKWRSGENILTTTKYKALIANTFRELNTLESHLNEEIGHTRKYFLSDRVNYYIQLVRDNLTELSPQSNEQLKYFWNKFELCLKEIQMDFPTEHLAVFARDSFVIGQKDSLKIVAWSGESKKIAKNYLYNLNKLSYSVYDQILTSDIHPELLQGFEPSNHIDDTKDFVRVFPSPSVKDPIYVIWVRHDNSKWPRLLKKETADSEFNSMFTLFWTFISLIYTSIWANRSKQILTNALRVLGHEIGQLSLGLEAVRGQYFERPQFLKMLSNDKISLINSDIEGLLTQIRFLTDGTKSIVTEFPKIHKSSLNMHFIFTKWLHLYRLEILHKKIKLNILTTPRYDPNQPPMFADEILLQQLLYNLLSNAIKYSHQGTIVHLNYEKEITNFVKYGKITVTNYGIEADPNIKDFKLYYRGENVKGIEGLGIGLHIAKKIALLHGGDLTFTCRKISPYNVPLIEQYLQLVSEGSIEEESATVANLENELANLRSSGIITDLVAKTSTDTPLYIPKKYEMRNKIKYATFEVSFSALFKLGD